LVSSPFFAISAFKAAISLCKSEICLFNAAICAALVSTTTGAATGAVLADDVYEVSEPAVTGEELELVFVVDVPGS
jgi:hypothetical protein